MLYYTRVKVGDGQEMIVKEWIIGATTVTDRNRAAMARMIKAPTFILLVILCYSHSLIESYHYVTAWSLRSPLGRVWKSLRRRHVVSFPSDTNTTDIHDYFMQMALQQAEKASRINEVPIGAVVVRPVLSNTKDTNKKTHFQVLGRACNRVETMHDASAHAELLAMRQASSRVENWRLLNATLYSTLEPCPMCLAASQGFRIHQIVYGAPDLRLGAVETHMRLLDVPHPFHTISNVERNVQANKSVELIQGFFQRRRLESKTQKKTRGR
jgi:tRNA(adenine34) deaminase